MTHSVHRSEHQPGHLIGLRTTVICLSIAPACEVVEGVLSPLKGTSTRADMTAITTHQGLLVASVLVGLLGTLLYIPAYLGAAARLSSRSRRLAVIGGTLSAGAMLGFAGVRMVSGIQLQAVREPMGLSAATHLVDHLAANPIMAVVLVLFLGGLAVGDILLGTAAWRAGMPRPAAAWWALFPVVAFFVDDLHWGNVATHLLLLASLTWIGRSLAELSPRRLLGTRRLAAVMVAAPVLEVVEQLISPLRGGSTAADLRHISGHEGTFTISVLVGLVAVVLYVPAFLGLAARCLHASPRVARLGAVVVVASMAGFMGIRVVQALELQLVKDGIAPTAGGRLVDHLSGNAVGAPYLALFLGGSVVGLVALAVAAWRAGLPRPAAVALGVFPLVDLLAPGRIGTIGSHLLLLAALAWLALAVVRRDVAAAPSGRPTREATFVES